MSKDANFLTAVIKALNLYTPLEQFEYMQINLKHVTVDIQLLYNLAPPAHTLCKSAKAFIDFHKQETSLSVHEHNLFLSLQKQWHCFLSSGRRFPHPIQAVRCS